MTTVVIEYRGDPAELARVAVRHQPALRRYRANLLGLGAVLALLGIGCLGRSDALAAVLAAGAGSCFLSASPPVMHHRARRQYEGRPSSSAAVRHELDGTGIRSTIPWASSTLEWVACRSWHPDAGGAVVAWEGGAAVLWLPRRGLVAPATWDDLVALLDAHLPRR